MRQHSDRAIVLTRVDYSERDRILTVLCRNGGKISVLAKGVRAQKSRLAGGIELLSESDISYVEGRSTLMTLTAARLHQHFGNVTSDIRRMQQAFAHIKTVNSVIDDNAGQEYYPLLMGALAALNDASYDRRIIDIWFILQILQTGGSAPNLLLASDEDHFEFNYDAQQFMPNPTGLFTRNDLKVLRLCLSGARPPRLSAPIGSEDRLQQLMQTILKTNATEL